MQLQSKFNVSVASKLDDRDKLDKIKNSKKSKVKVNSIIDLLEIIKQDVNTHLGEYTEKYEKIVTMQQLDDYIEHANKVGYIAIDTETMGLNPLTDQIVGICLYTPGQKASYIPINHVDYFSNIRINEQLTEEMCRECLSKLTAKIIYHNAQFDIREIKHWIGI